MNTSVMKMLGKALFVLTSFLFLCVLLFIVSSKLFGVRPIISWASKTFTEYEVLIHEEASINYFPYLEFDAKNVVLKESDRITSDGFIKINSLKFQINTKKLITQQSVAIKISVDGFDITSKFNDAHSTNIDTLLSTNFDIEGHIVGNLKIGASAESWSELNENINGTFELSLYNGLWKENDIFYMLRRARAIYKRDEDPEYTNKTIKQEFSIQASGNIIDSTSDVTTDAITEGIAGGRWCAGVNLLYEGESVEVLDGVATTVKATALRVIEDAEAAKAAARSDERKTNSFKSQIARSREGVNEQV